MIEAAERESLTEESVKQGSERGAEIEAQEDFMTVTIQVCVFCVYVCVGGKMMPLAER